MNYTDNELQAAIDAAMLEIGKKVSGPAFAACPKAFSFSWPVESTARLALAKTFLAKLPEPEPILADDGRSLGEVCSDAALAAGLNRATSKECDEAAAQAVAAVVLAKAIRRMEAVPVEELKTAWITTLGDDFSSFEAIRSRLIAAYEYHKKQTP